MSKLSQPFILVAESDEVDQSVIERGLCSTGSGLNILFAQDGEEALQVLAEGLPAHTPELPALILLSMHLPKIDGDEVLKRLKSNPSTVSIPVIAMVNPGNDQDCERALAYGADGTIDKTFEFEDFITTLRSVANFVLGKTHQLPRPISVVNGAELL